MLYLLAFCFRKSILKLLNEKWIITTLQKSINAHPPRPAVPNSRPSQQTTTAFTPLTADYHRVHAPNSRPPLHSCP